MTLSSIFKASLPILVQWPILIFIAYITVHYTVDAERKDREQYEKQYVENLKGSVRIEASINAENIRKWIPELIGIIGILEDFVENRNPKSPAIDVDYGSLVLAAHELLTENLATARHIQPCLHTSLTAMHHRIREGNNVKRAVDDALVEYTAASVGPLPDAYVAAARLHARIEQLLHVYKMIPGYLARLLHRMDKPNCGKEKANNNKS